MNRYRPLFFVFILVFISSCITSSKNSTVSNDTRKLYLPVKNNKIIYSQVVKDSSLTKDELFKKAKRWMYSVFDPKNLKTFDGKGYSQIVGTGFVAEVNDPNFLKNEGLMKGVVLLCHLTLEIRILNGKYRYGIYGFYYTDPFNSYKSDETLLSKYRKMVHMYAYRIHPRKAFLLKKNLIILDHKIKEIIESLKTAMK